MPVLKRLVPGQVLVKGVPGPGAWSSGCCLLSETGTQQDSCIHLVWALFKINVPNISGELIGKKASLHSRLSNSLVSAPLKIICHLLLISSFVRKAIACLKERGRRSC